MWTTIINNIFDKKENIYPVLSILSLLTVSSIGFFIALYVIIDTKNKKEEHKIPRMLSTIAIIISIILFAFYILMEVHLYDF